MNVVPILTTIHLLHKLNVNVTPLVSSPSFDQTNSFNNNRRNQDLNGRKRIDEEILDQEDQDKLPNPYQFRPREFAKPPKIIPYSGNPFLNRLSSTTMSPLDLGEKD